VAAWLLFVTLISAVQSAFAQPSMQTVFTNGPTSNRLNIVVLSEGYTSSQFGQFTLDASNALSVLLSHPPYKEYSNYCNAFAIKVASIESGSDHPSWPLYRDTYFNSTYDSDGGSWLTIPTDATGQGKVDTLLQQFMPKYHLPILLVNDRTAGGSDGFDKIAIVSTGAVTNEGPPLPPGILSHEVGHVLANLGDEYTDPYLGFPDTEEPNTTRETNRTAVKWKAWISANTPVPTPADYGEGVVGLFEGAHYHTTGWYRPELNCTMGSLGVPFCHVCSEALVLAVYQWVRPVDGVSPTNTNLTITNSQTVSFSLALLQPAPNYLGVQWYTNGVSLNGATNAAFTLLPLLLGNGSHLLSAVVKDHTPRVRNDPTNLLSQTNTWMLSVSIPQLRLDSPSWSTNGKFTFRISGYAPHGVVVQCATNLSSWGAIATNYLTNGLVWFTDTNSSASGSLRRFYRAAISP
jgi:hypothetical protein